MNVTLPNKACLFCGTQLKGRIDKKYCDDICRNNYNNQVNYADNHNYLRNINNSLKKNRRVLKDLLGIEEKITIAKARLLQDGFNFKYITHTYTNKKDNVYFFCYDHGYMFLENERCLVVKRREDS